MAIAWNQPETGAEKLRNSNLVERTSGRLNGHNFIFNRKKEKHIVETMELEIAEAIQICIRECFGTRSINRCGFSTVKIFQGDWVRSLLGQLARANDLI